MAEREIASTDANSGSRERFIRSGASAGPPASRAEYVHLVLREEILSGKLRPGASVAQDEIANRLGVSITPVREALRRLEAAGLIHYEAHHGATVAFLSDEALSELYLLRSVVEGLAARLAASRVTETEIRELEGIQREMIAMARCSDVAGMAAGSRQFHTLIAEIGGPAYLAKHLRLIWEHSPIPTNQSIWAHEGPVCHSLEMHAKLIEALRRKCGSLAESLMSEHVLDVIEQRREIGHSSEENSDLKYRSGMILSPDKC